MQNSKTIYGILFGVLFSLMLTEPASARVYKNKKVGEYETSFNLAEHKGQTLLNFIKVNLYDAIKAEAKNKSSMAHVDSIEVGEGVELRLAEDVTTYHVKYKEKGEDKAERSGRSFGAVGSGDRVDYLADASYKHFLSSLEDVLTDEVQARGFYTTILQIMLNSDPSGMADLDFDTKKVAADFVAVLVAEQYRRLIHHDGEELARFPEWDNAHFHVTLLANFHAGQSAEMRGMYYLGEYKTELYHQIDKNDEGEKVCAYDSLESHKDPVLDGVRIRKFNMTDYWQFNWECKRSGVNMTRSDFVKMSWKLSNYITGEYPEVVANLKEITQGVVTEKRNINDRLADFIISDWAPESFEDADALVTAIVDYLMLVRTDADIITDSL